MEIKVLASGSSGNAYIVSDGETHLLLECGIPINDLKVKTNFFYPRPEACLISHSHGDHAKAVKDIIKRGIPCYMSHQTLTEISEKVELKHGVYIIDDKWDFKIGTLKILPLKLEHDVYCLGFYIYSAVTQESLFFATDTCKIPYKLPPMDYIMVEANYDLYILNDRIRHGYIDPSIKKRLVMSHMEIGQTIRWLQKQDLSMTRRIYLLHLSDGSANAEQFKKSVIEVTGVPVTIA